jgi:hypothetical protein
MNVETREWSEKSAEQGRPSGSAAQYQRDHLC